MVAPTADSWMAPSAGAGTVVPCLVGGEWVVPEGERRPVIEPATGAVLAELGWGGAAEANAAADAAQDAFAAWSGRPARQRGDVLRRAADLLEKRASGIAPLLARESGKRLVEAEAEVRFTADFLRWFADAVRGAAGEVLRSEQAGRHQVTFTRPAGVAACLTPWNFPLSIPARKIAPALAAGCTVVARVSERAPMAAIELFRALVDADAPAGVVNLVHGPAAEVTDAYLRHPAVRVVSFTGSTEVGRRIMVTAAERIVRPVLELGGNAPFVVFADADLDAAVGGLMVSKFRNNGQSCIAANRVYVHRAVLDAFLDRLANAVGSMRVGDPLDPGSDLGPLIDRSRVDEVGALVDEACAGGAQRIAGGGALPERGTWQGPCFVVEPPPTSGLATTEVFGPAAGVFGFDSEDEVVEKANATDFGLASYFYTTDVRRAWRMSERLEAGIIGCNDPVPPVTFGALGGMKQSGIGREGGRLGLEEFEEWRYVSFGA